MLFPQNNLFFNWTEARIQQRRQAISDNAQSRHQDSSKLIAQAASHNCMKAEATGHKKKWVLSPATTQPGDETLIKAFKCQGVAQRNQCQVVRLSNRQCL